MPITGESWQSVLDHARPQAQRGWSAQTTLGAAFFFAFLAAQILVPGFLLLQPRPRKFGWQIYAYPVGLAEPAVGVELADGTEVAPQSYSHIKEWLPDLGYDRGLATYLCGITPESRAVVLTRTFPAHQLVRYPCP